MTRMTALAASAALTLAASGCGDAGNAPEGDPAPVAASSAAPTQAASPTPIASAEPAGEASGADIPAALRGRWGLVAADCTSTRGDAKGLITISATDIRFYESVARLGTIRERSADALRADWAFTGEGQSWTRDLALTRKCATLERREYGEEALAAPLTYTRCA